MWPFHGKQKQAVRRSGGRVFKKTQVVRALESMTLSERKLYAMGRISIGEMVDKYAPDLPIYRDREGEYWTATAMRKYGGSFVRTLADLIERADDENIAKIRRTWPEYYDDYYEQGQKLRFDACPEGMCDGSKELPSDETDGDGNVERGVGTRKCLCAV